IHPIGLHHDLSSIVVRPATRRAVSYPDGSPDFRVFQFVEEPPPGEDTANDGRGAACPPLGRWRARNTSGANPTIAGRRLFEIMGAMSVVPIARINCVPNQRIDPKHPLRIGVVAFSAGNGTNTIGIRKVEFTITGQGYTGGVKKATAM